MTTFLQHIVQVCAAGGKRAEVKVGAFSLSRYHVIAILCNAVGVIGWLQLRKVPFKGDTLIAEGRERFRNLCVFGTPILAGDCRLRARRLPCADDELRWPQGNWW